MSILAKLIHQSNMTYIPTKLPVKFFGLPDGKVYMVYARFCKRRPDKTDLEFVLAEHEEFSFDYPNGVLVPKSNSRYPVYSEMVDKPNPIFHILQVSRDIKSYSEAVDFIHKKAREMVFDSIAC